MASDSIADLLALLGCGVLAAACGTDDNAPSSGGGPEVQAAVAACGPYAEKQAECVDYPGFNYLTALGYCLIYLGYSDISGPDCRTAYEDWLACFSTVDCAVLQGEEPPSEYPCEPEELALERECWESERD